MCVCVCVKKVLNCMHEHCVFDISGLRLLGAFTDLNEASSLTYANDMIDIYSNSWGPCDEGCVDGPLRLTELALKTGAERVRRETIIFVTLCVACRTVKYPHFRYCKFVHLYNQSIEIVL